MKFFKKAKRGFTLVELVVVIAVIAILAGVSVGAYFGITDSANNSKLQQEAKTALTNIQLVGSQGGSNAKLSSSGLYIDDLDLFSADLDKMSGAHYDLVTGENPDEIFDYTLYFFKAPAQSQGQNVVKDTFDTFAYYNPEVLNKRARVDVKTGDITIEEANFDAPNHGVVTQRKLLSLTTNNGTLGKTKYINGETLNLGTLRVFANYSKEELQEDITSNFTNIVLTTDQTEVNLSYTFEGVSKDITIGGFEVFESKENFALFEELYKFSPISLDQYS